MSAIYEYLKEFTKAKQERLVATWTEAAPQAYRWEDIVANMKSKNAPY